MFRDSILRAWLHSSDSRAETEIEHEIDEELQFHLESLVNENRAKGMSLDVARFNACNRFGSVERYSEACRWIDLGDRVMLQRFLAIGLIIVGLLVGLLFFEVRALRRQQRAAVQRPSAGTAGLGASQSELSDLAGQVVDSEKNPLPDVDLLVILKTWPDGRYRQQSFSAKTNNKGHFRLKDLVPLAVRHAVQVAALREGYALQSVYHLRPDGATRPLEPVKFSLAKATPVTLLIQDGQGRPVPNVRIAPASRKSPDGQEHLVYFQASAPVHLASDDQGRVGLRWFSDGDSAKLHLRVPGEDWESRIVDISRKRNVVEISVPSR